MIGAAKDGDAVKDVMIFPFVSQAKVYGEGAFVTGLFHHLLQFFIIGAAGISQEVYFFV